MFFLHSFQYFFQLFFSHVFVGCFHFVNCIFFISCSLIQFLLVVFILSTALSCGQVFLYQTFCCSAIAHLNFWCFALLHATYLINCIPTPLLHNKSPYEQLYTHPCDISNLRVFGCLCYISTLQSHRQKLDHRAHPCIFIGFKPNTKGYLVYDLHSHSINTSRNVVFYEDHFPILPDTSESSSSSTSISPLPFSNNTDNFEHPTPPSAHLSSPHTSFTPKRRSTRLKKAPTYLQDYHHALTSQDDTNTHGVRYPLHSVLSYSRLSPSHKHFVMSISVNTEPKSYNEASKFDCWIKAMQAELQALQQNQTWTLTPLPPHKTAIDLYMAMF